MVYKAVIVLFALAAALRGCLGARCSSGIQSQGIPPTACLLTKVNTIPSRHIYKRRSCRHKPLVMGHRGNPQVAQENSMRAIEAVQRYGADGFEVDVFMTKDKELVCFHDKNTLRLTGVDRDIEQLTKQEIKAMSFKKVIQYDNQWKAYDRRRPIAFLDEVLTWAKTTSLLVYIEMKPEPAIDASLRQQQIARSMEMAEKVARLVKRMKMVDQVIVNSFDVIKSLYAKKTIPELVIGTTWTPDYWKLPSLAHDLQKQEFKALYPGLCTCLNDIPVEGNVFIDFLLQSGSVEKSTAASMIDLQFDMFNNTQYGGASHTMCMLEENYGKGIIVGSYTLHDLSKTQDEIDAEKPLYRAQVEDGVDLFYTDDICQMIDLINSTPYRRCSRRRSAGHRHNQHVGRKYYNRHSYSYGHDKYPYPRHDCNYGHYHASPRACVKG